MALDTAPREALPVPMPQPRLPIRDDVINAPYNNQEEAEPIQVDTAVAALPDTGISVDTGAPTPRQLPPDVAASRAHVATQAVGTVVSKDYDEIHAAITGGGEEALRQEAATRLQQQESRQRTDILIRLSKQGPLTPEVYKRVDDVLYNMRKGVAPEAVFEWNFSKNYLDQMNLTAMKSLESPLLTAMKQFPVEVEQIKGLGADRLAKRMYFTKLQQDWHAQVGEQGTGSWLMDQLKSFVPGYGDYKMRGNVEGVTPFLGFKGTNVRAQIEALYRLPFDQFTKEAKRIIDTLGADNPTLAVEFAHAGVGMSSVEEGLANLASVLDLTAAKPIGAAVGIAALRKAGLTAAIDGTNAMLRAAGKGAAETKALMLGASGDTAGAASTKLTGEVVKAYQGVSQPLKGAVESMSPIMDNLRANPGVHSQELVNEISEMVSSRADKVHETVTNAAKVNVAPQLAVQALVDEALDRARGLLTKHKTSGIGTMTVYDPELNVYRFNNDIVQANRNLFRSVGEAENYKRAYPELASWKVVPTEWNANGYVLREWNTLNIGDNVIRDGALKAPGAVDPEGGYVTAFFGKYRTPNETLSQDQIRNRLVATTGPNEFYKMFYEMGADIRKMARWGNIPFTKAKQQWADLKTVMDFQEGVFNPVTQRNGKWAENFAELDQLYDRRIGRKPDASEVRGYFSFKTILEHKDFLSRRKDYVDRMNRGAQNYTVSTADASGKKNTSAFDGTKLNEFPEGERGTIARIGRGVGEEDIDTLGNMNPGRLSSWKERVAQGKSYVIRLDPTEVGRKPLQGLSDVFGNKRITHVMVDSVDSSKPVAMKPTQGPRLDLEYDHPFSIVQAKISKDTIQGRNIFNYEGDNLIMPISIRAAGQDIAKNLNEVRLLMKSGDFEAARKLTAEKLHIPPEKVEGWFKWTVTRDGTAPDNMIHTPPRLSLDEPIQVIGKNRYLGKEDGTLAARYTSAEGDAVKSKFVDTTRDNPRFNPADPNGEAIFTLADEGSKGNPLYKVVASSTVDVANTLEKGLARMVRSTFMDDYKQFSTNDWLQKAKQWLTLDGKPTAWDFHNPVWSPQAPKEVVARLEVQRFQIQQLLGIPSENEGILQRMAQDLSDSIYTKFGPKAVLVSPTWLLPKLADPTAFVRAVTFHATLGLFNIPQLLVQLQTHTNIAGIAGFTKAAQGTAASLLHSWGGVNKNPAILSRLDELASKMGWRPGEFTEAHQAGKSMGWFDVAGDYYLDIYQPKMFTSLASIFLDAGTVFFKSGERGVRASSWYTAFKEFRDVNPTGRLTEANKAAILERADLLNGNMTKASNSLLHTGKMAATSQFLSYQIRQFEIVTGKRLSTIERARLLFANAAMYGAPAALGVSGVPIAESLRKAALEGGYQVGDNWIETAATEGIPAMLVGLATGGYDKEGKYQLGTIPNVGERYGNSGATQLKDLLSSDASWMKIVGGAAFGKLSSAFSHYEPFYYAMQSAMRGDGEFKLTTAHMLDVLTEINSVRDAKRAYVAATTGRLISKKEDIQDTDMSPQGALAMLFSGLQPQETADQFKMITSMKEQKEAWDQGLNFFRKEFRRGLIEFDNSNMEQGNQYMKNAFSALRQYNYPEEDMGKAISIAMKGMEPMARRIKWDFYVKKAPPDKRDKREEAFINMIKRQGY